MGTILEVTDIKTGKKIHVRVNDRGPFVRGRVIDLSYGAFRRLSSRGGLVNVRIRPVGTASKHHGTRSAALKAKQPSHTRAAIQEPRPVKRQLEIVPDEGYYSQPIIHPFDKVS
jgi:rare lipoprotein A